ncbi:hypothetical protein GYH30_029284 [Glycine max]|nr:hypothetical protein GYH30_029284 [Glycine max]
MVSSLSFAIPCIVSCRNKWKNHKSNGKAAKLGRVEAMSACVHGGYWIYRLTSQLHKVG